jgi:hypothetical protein
MAFASFYMIVFLLLLMIGSVVFARYAQERQESDVIRLYRLAALDRRRNETRAVIRAVQTSSRKSVRPVPRPLPRARARSRPAMPARRRRTSAPA